jgi:prepilin-type N-terminal cleavage/methylation domain-containing protein
MKRISHPTGGVLATNPAARGFTLIEMLVSLAILVTVTGAVFEQINSMQKKSASEAVNLDLAQQSRDFVNQIVHDLHMAGYPAANMYSVDPLARPSMIANRLVRVSPTEILLEGDVNNDGAVESVDIAYVASDPNDPNCPCIRRSAQPKIEADSFSQPTNLLYTETQQVFPPGTGAGQSGENLFAYYDQNGNPVAIGSGVDISTPASPTTQSGQALISSIKTVKINLSLLTNQRDPLTGNFVRASTSASARLSY